MGVSPIDPHWGWLLLAIALAAGEILKPGIALIWIAAAAFVIGIATRFVDIPAAPQLALFAAASIGAVYAAKKWARPAPAETGETAGEDRTSRMIGRRGVVVEAIVGGAGRVRYGETTWSATGPNMGIGDAARILAIDGERLVVGPAGRRSRRPPVKEAAPRQRSRRRRSSRPRSGDGSEPTA